MGLMILASYGDEGFIVECFLDSEIEKAKKEYKKIELHGLCDEKILVQVIEHDKAD